MTKEDFLKLTPHAQEDLLNSGIEFSEDSKRKVMISPTLVETPEPLVERGFPSSIPRNDTHTESCPPEEKFSEVKTASGESKQYREYPQGYEEGVMENVYGFKNPVELLYLLDDDISSGRVTLHNWQVQFMLDFAEGIHSKPSQEDPFQAVVRAANGSGKDKYCIAPCAIWLNMATTMYASSVVTSSSGVQLDNQTCAYIELLCREANKKIHPKCWKINYRYYECLDTHSPIMCFATDEPGKAEGYHPLKHGSSMALFESEAKTVPDSIYVAQNKCTGYTHRCMVSTPGLPMGHFFDCDQMAVDRKDIEKGFKKTSIDYVRYLVTAYDCPHIPLNYIEQMKRDLPGHEHGAAFKSQVMAEFGTTDEMVVIPSIYVRKCIKEPPLWIKEPFNKAGLDLSDGGDETALTVRNGNRHLITIPFKFDNTEDTIAHLNSLFVEWDLNHPQSYIFSDMGGLGKPMLDRMKRQGWGNIRYIDNRTAAARPATYRNRGAELWFNVRLLCERNEIAIVDEQTLFRQLCTRYYKLSGGTIHQLLSKAEQKSRGYPSPDRADSFVLAFWDYKSTYVEQIIKELPFEAIKDTEAERYVAPFDIKQWAVQDTRKALAERVELENLEDLQDDIASYNRQRRLTKQQTN